MKLYQQISNWLKEYLDSNKLKTFVVGVSGGIDSALVSTLCAETGRRTIVVSMPIHQAQDQLDRARDHISWLKNKYTNVEFLEFDLSNTFDAFKSLFAVENKLALANSKSRLRMTTLYQVAGTFNGIVVGTGNKIEDFGIGFFTKYGDGGVDISPIGDLTKTEVRSLARELKIIEDILVAKPTDGLWEDDKTDEEQIGATYEELEWAMNYSGSIEDLKINNFGYGSQEVYEIYHKLHNQNKHKMISIPIFKKC